MADKKITDIIDERIKKIYSAFRNTPIKLVRSEDDAFVLLAFELILRDHQDIPLETNRIDELAKYIVEPPDDGIDIFFEEGQIEDFTYHIIQVKNEELPEVEINAAFSKMKQTVNSYLKSPSKIKSEALKDIISQTSFTDAGRKCCYYVVHRGNTSVTRKQQDDEIIIAKEQLETLQTSIKDYYVPHHVFGVDHKQNFILYNYEEKGLPNALLCNINGLELANLCSKYDVTTTGRNILFGENFRDPLEKGNNKTYDKMVKTIREEPDNFWFYNNGITIIAEEVDPDHKKKNDVSLKKFSIINGAQTTSTLASYLRRANKGETDFDIAQLKKVFVLTRIISLAGKDVLKRKIAEYSNTQNPIIHRDLVSNRPEQEHLYKKLLEGSIWMKYRRGQDYKKIKAQFFPHQYTDNEILGQLALCGFIKSPFRAKDKKKNLFKEEMNEKKDTGEKYNLNKDYDEIFNYFNQKPVGVLFEKNNIDIDELLFIFQLHKVAKKELKKYYEDEIVLLEKKLDEPNSENKKTKELIDINRRAIEITEACLFYNIYLYFEFKDYFEERLKIKYKRFNYLSYYNAKEDYKQTLTQAFIDHFFLKTIDIIKANSGVKSVANWLRIATSEAIFKENLNEDLSTNGIKYSKEYSQFLKLYKT
ncbi:MAG TPA: AIPR family protein [Chitinophagales bacterium]|nr:AIPR family protein [Chitinophagales bacterium]